jgi:hypothetical protein
MCLYLRNWFVSDPFLVPARNPTAGANNLAAILAMD